MLLRNYYNYMACATLGVNGYKSPGISSNTFCDGVIYAKNSSGTTAPFEFAKFGLGGSKSLGTVSPSTEKSSVGCIIIGSGNTPVTFEDYKLNSIITSGWSKGGITIVSPTYDSSNKKYLGSMTVPITNLNSSTNIIVNEIGIVFYGNSAEQTLSILVYREVLPAAVTIAPGETQVLELQLEYTFPEVPTT